MANPVGTGFPYIPPGLSLAKGDLSLLDNHQFATDSINHYFPVSLPLQHKIPKVSLKIDHKIRIDHLEFNCLTSGNPSNPLVILLHGFPESAFMWRRLMDELSTEAYYCIAPDMRGYSPNAAPSGKREYTIDKLAQDVLDIASTCQETFHLIAHDWGAAIGWHLAYNHADRLISYSALSVPHHRAFGKALKIDKLQKRKSRYILWFLLPILPEIYLKRRDFEAFKKLWKESDSEEVEYNLRIFRHKNSLTNALNYYRANTKTLKNQKIGNIDIPTLFIWGNRDLAIGRTAAISNEKYMSNAYKFIEIDGGHWLIQSNFLEVKNAISEHLTAYR